MAVLTTDVIPNGTVSVTNVNGDHTRIDEDPQSPDNSVMDNFPGTSGSAWFNMSGLHASYQSLVSVVYELNWRASSLTDDTIHLDIGFYKSDQTTLIASEERVVTVSSSTGATYQTNAATIVNQPTFEEFWDGLVKVTWTYSANMGGDGGALQLDAFRMQVQYNSSLEGGAVTPAALRVRGRDDGLDFR